MLQRVLFSICSLLPIIHAHGTDAHHLEHRNVATEVITACKTSKTFALTFDDGPYIYENKISDYLVKNGIRGTFFINGYNFDCIYNQQIVDQLTHTFKQGHLIGSHTWSHPNITLLTATQLNRELELVETAMKKILGVVPRYFRPPYGAITEENLIVLKKRGYTVVNWNLDSGDSLGLTAAESMKEYDQTARKYPRPQISLNHETKQPTAESVTPYAVTALKKAGYRLVDVAECLGLPSTPAQFYQSVGKPQKRDSSWTCEGTPVPGAPIV
ncbi:family 4 carbohydrate esterase [Melampsora larici-populina 98AG31]|uniref:Family 4 carbohydrate esterase n=1 Tax=Melampsora larici-populina (strain 98AG31 / pathotype 3-4-7) TaxID=747676 RepID=F4S7H0_MELLP|nr:family 4 carbohydrate esterase [Melampsora larici-populina 98AG31]EGF99408.1 family 4 carbohydrate esterase [Melampsora larici-populina 98AG31]